MNFIDLMGAASFANRFDAIKDLLPHGSPLPREALGFSSEGVPLPRARPEMEAPPSAPMPASPMMPEGPAMRPPADPMEMSGQSRRSSGGPGLPINDGLLSMLTGNPDASRRIKAALAGGMRGGNPAFGAGAFMRGMGGGLDNAAKSDQNDFDERVSLLDRAIRNRRVDLADESAESLNTLRRAQAERASRPASQRGAWNKPPAQLTMDSERLINDRRKTLRRELGIDDPLLSPTERSEREGRYNTEMETYGNDIRRRLNVPSGSSPGEISMSGNGTREKPYSPATSADYDEIPSGTYYLHPSDNKLRLKK